MSREFERSFISNRGDERADDVDREKRLVMTNYFQNEAELRELEKEYIENFPNQLEGITVLFDLIPHLQASQKISKEIEGGMPEVIEQLRNLAEYQFLITHFIINNSDKEFISKFWGIIESIAQAQGGAIEKEMTQLKRAVLSVVAVYKSLETLNQQPALASPQEDVVRGVDIWTQRGWAIQVKSFSEHPDGMGVFLKYKQGKKIRDYTFPDHTSRMIIRNGPRFEGIVKFFKKNQGNLYNESKVHPVYVLVPPSQYDPTTGEPSDNFMDELRMEIIKSESGRHSQ